MLKVGETIKCHDAEDLAFTRRELEKYGIHTDTIYEKDGKNGYWLIVTEVEK